MEQWQREHINRNLPALRDDTTCNSDLLSRLKAVKILTQNECDELEARELLKGKSAQTSLFYEILQRKEGAYEELIVALKDAIQSGAARILENGKRLREEDTGVAKAEESPPPSKRVCIHPGLKKGSDHIESPPPPQSSEIHSKSGDEDDLDLDDDTNPEVLDFLHSKEKLDVVVQLPMKGTDLKSLVDSYNLPSTGCKGLALILNIVKFEDEETWGRRQGSEKDVEYLTELLYQLGYEIYPKSKKERDQELKVKLDINELLQEFKGRVEARKPASIIVFIGSHGFYPNTIVTSELQTDPTSGKKTQVTLDLYEDIVSQFFHDSCQALKGKPKIFLVQACQTFCRNERDDCAEGGREPKIADALVVTAQMPGGEANRDIHKGSWFVYCFTYVMMKYAREKSLQDILGMVTKMLERIKGVKGTEQVPMIVEHKMKPLHFPMEP